MAVACTAMEVHDRRLSISKASASKISKPSPVLKNLSQSSSSPSSSASSPPSQLPSSITSSPSRPIAKVVKADPSSFRRVVQELTGTTFPSTSSPSSQPLRGLSRLHRIAPPPLRSGVRTLQDPHHHQTLLEQMQHQQASHMHLLQQHLPKVGPLSPTLSFAEFGNPNPNPISDPSAQLGNPNPNFTQSLPMLSPHLLSPLPALTPGDNTWANPIDVISQSPKPMISSSSLPPLLPLPNLSTGNYNNGHGNALLAKPVHTSNVYGDAMWMKPTPPMSSILSSHAQALPPLLSTPPPPWLMPHTSSMNVLPPWSPSPIPFSPGLFPPSPGHGAPPMAAAPHVNNANPNSHIKYSSMNPNVPKNFTF